MAQPRVQIEYVQFYTSGSTAKKVAPAISAQTGKLPRVKKQSVRKIYVDPVATLGAVVAACMLVMMLVGYSSLHTQQEKTAAMEAQVEQLRQENASLQAQYEAECDLEQVEETALALGMIPSEQADHISIEVQLPPAEEVQPASLWQQIGTFLTNLFA